MPSHTSWLKSIEPAILKSINAPMWGTMPSFPTDILQENLKTLFQGSECFLESGDFQWKMAEHFYSGFSNQHITTTFSMTPLEGSLAWIMNQSDVKDLVNLLKDESNTVIKSDHPEIISALFQYILLNSLSTIEREKVYKDLTIKMTDAPFQAETAYAMDFSIEVSGKTFWGRVLCSETLQKNIAHHFALDRPSLENLSDLLNIYLPISITTGTASLSSKELSQVEIGDLLIIDNNHYSPSKKKGTFRAMLQDQPLFQVKKKEGGLKIMDFIYFYEDNSMDDDFDSNPFEDDETGFDLSEEDEMDNQGDQTASEELPSDDANEEKLFGDTPEINADDGDLHQSPLEKANISEIPVTIHMEIARVNLSLEKLKNMSPGEHLPLEIQPNLVELTVGGKSIGCGEIVEIGDLVGVKIVKLNK